MGAARAYRASRHWHHWALARCLGDDTNLNEFRWRDRSGSRCQTRGLPGRSPIVQKALRDPVPLGNNQNLTALGLHFGHQRRLGLRRPLPAALNHDLAIHSKHSFWIVQKDPASLSTLLSTTAGRPVQTGRLRRAGSHKRLYSHISGRTDRRCCWPSGSYGTRPQLPHPTSARPTLT